MGTTNYFVVDFGLCTDISNGPKVHLLGSPFWIPPEMIAQEPHGWQVHKLSPHIPCN